jgi:hypothetical protein
MIKDVSGNKVNAVLDLPVSTFIPDLTSPTLVKFLNLDLDAGTMQLEFDEPVDHTTFNWRNVSLVNRLVPSASHTLLNATIEYSTGSIEIPKSTVTLFLSDLDRLALAVDFDLAFDSVSSTVVLANNAISDMQGNPISDGALPALNYVTDSRNPQCIRFSLNLTSETLEMEFDVPVNPETLNTKFITIQSKADLESGVHFELTFKDTSRSQPGYVIEVDLSTSNVNGIKENPNLAIDANSTFMSLLPEVIFGVNNELAAVTAQSQALQVDTFTGDLISPTNGWVYT